MKDVQEKKKIKIILPAHHDPSYESDQIPLLTGARHGHNSRIIELAPKQALFIIGANGSGKTFFSVRLEELNWGKKSIDDYQYAVPFKEKSVRISAQRNLQIPLTVDLIAKQKAFDKLLYLNELKSSLNLSASEPPSYDKDPQAYIRTDMNTLLQYLLADRNAINEKRREHPDYISISDKIQQVWAKINPNQQFDFSEQGSLKIKFATIEGYSYSAKNLSDGERAAFYLIGYVLSMPENGLFIIDEPEQNLHKALVAPLWTLLERERPDLCFIYLTHDLDFVTQHQNKKLIWLQEYRTIDPKFPVFKYELIDHKDNVIPEELYLQILGTRQSIIFVEGKTDVPFYQALFPNHKIIEAGSCENVIDYNKAMRLQENLMHIKVYGIIDPDYRNGEEIKTTQKTVSNLNVMEIESLYFVPELFYAVYEDAGVVPDSDRKNLEAVIKKRLGEEGTINQHLTAIKRKKYGDLLKEHLVSKIHCKDTPESIIGKILNIIQDHDRSDQYKKYNDNIDLFDKKKSQKIENLTLEEIFQEIKIKSIYGEIFKALEDLGFVEEAYVRTVCKVLSNNQELRKTIQEKYISPVILENNLILCKETSTYKDEIQDKIDQEQLYNQHKQRRFF